MFHRILLPVDVLAQDLPALGDVLFRVVHDQIASESAELEAVFVLDPERAGLSSDELLRRMEFYRGLALSRLAERFSGPEPGRSVRFTVLPVLDPSRQSAVRALLAHGDKIGADLIALPTHARRGVDRFFLGSFAETLLLASPTPLLTLNPRVRPRSERHFLFCTDMSARSRRNLAGVLSLASRKGARVSVLHLVRPTPILSAATGYLGEEAIEGRLAEAGALLDRFCRGLDRGGVALDARVDVAVESEAESITDAAERLGASILFLGSAVRGKPLIPALGAISRQVIRRAPCPVLTLPGGDAP